MRAVITWLLLLLSATVPSRERLPPPVAVYRCGEAATLRYQDAPCAEGERSTRWRPASGRASPVRRAAAGTIRQTPARGRTRRGIVRRGPAAALITLQQDPDGCRRVRRLREQALRRRQRPAGYLVERAWEDRLRDACR